MWLGGANSTLPPIRSWMSPSVWKQVSTSHTSRLDVAVLKTETEGHPVRVNIHLKLRFGTSTHNMEALMSGIGQRSPQNEARNANHVSGTTPCANHAHLMACNVTWLGRRRLIFTLEHNTCRVVMTPGGKTCITSTSMEIIEFSQQPGSQSAEWQHAAHM